MPAFGGDVVAVIEKLGARGRGADRPLDGRRRHRRGGARAARARRGARLGRRLHARSGSLTRWRRSRNSCSRSAQTSRRRTRPVGQMFVPGSDPAARRVCRRRHVAAPPRSPSRRWGTPVSNDDAILAALRELQAPVVAINPDYRPTDIGALRRHGVELVLMPGVGHFLMLEDPDTFNRLLGETIGSDRAAG